METVQRFKRHLSLFVLFILLGITLIIWPEFSLLTICKLCAWLHCSSVWLGSSSI